MASPTVSIIVPNYNHAPYLRERIDSILRQTYQDFELLLLDDCSTDESREIINSYAGHPRVSQIVLNEQNTGNTFLQWERGIKLSQGEYIWIAESDDVAEPQFLETLVHELHAHPEAVVAYSHSQMIDNESRPMSLTWHRHGSSGQTNVFDGMYFIHHMMLTDNRIYNASMTIFKKSVFDLLPTDYQHYRYSGDWLFWFYVCLHGQVIEVCRQLNHFRQHKQKVTVSADTDGRKWRDNAGIMRTMIKTLNLSSIKRQCIRGRWTKRFNKENGNRFPEIRQEFPELYNGNFLDICVYEIGKLFGFLKV